MRAESNLENPLLQAATAELPPYPTIKPEHVEPALRTVIDDNRRRLAVLPAAATTDWSGLMRPLEEMEERLERVWGPVRHLNAVCDSKALRPAHQRGLMQVTAYRSECMQNEALFAAVERLQASPGFQGQPPERRQAVHHLLRDFRLGGAALPREKKDRFKAIQVRLSELGAQFEQNVLDATRAWRLHVRDTAELAGLPQREREAARERARREGLKGWLFTLDAPSYIPFMQYAENRALRRRMYTAYVTRAASGKLDNGPIILEILKLRREAAKLLGYKNHAEVSLANKMATSPREVIDFLRELATRSRPRAQGEIAELAEFARNRLHLDRLEAWDLDFAGECLRRERYAFSQQDLKPYFPEPQVLEGLFAVAGRLYGLRFEVRPEVPRWHEDVRFFDVFDAQGQRIAGFYLDLYARPHKRGGAWMDECIIRWRRPDGTLQRPVAHVVCNFSRPAGGNPALWSHEEVITLFHEFGHALHHMLTEVETLEVSGIRGVPWDAVELPSQLMENFCWHYEALDLFARHYRSGAVLPRALFEKMRAARNFQAGMKMLRQIEYALFDFLLHVEFDPASGGSVQDVLDAVHKEVAVFKPPQFNRFQNSFSHIFAGGYAAGYYSYKWAEVMAADAFAAFEETGIFDAATAQRLRREVLAVGGARDMTEAFAAFRGRKPKVDALLRQYGLLPLSTTKSGD